jgi:hypothetical protein
VLDTVTNVDLGQVADGLVIDINED